MPSRRSILRVLVISSITMVTPWVKAGADTSSATAELTQNLAQSLGDDGINIIFIRHALAPGYGDPSAFDVTDCSTQRNLNDVGIRQAQALGREIKTAIAAAKRPLTAVLSSQWCRCLDTAAEMALGPVEAFAGLNSFFQGYADQEATLAMLTSKTASLSADDLVIMVTHQVVIRAATGISPPSGGLVLHNTSTGVSTPLNLIAID